jgi:uncharacterized membrane protein YjgN (DUF898 family)
MIKSIFICGILVLLVSLTFGWLILQLIQPMAPVALGLYVMITILLLAVGIYLTVRGLRIQNRFMKGTHTPFCSTEPIGQVLVVVGTHTPFCSTEPIGQVLVVVGTHTPIDTR